jgi:hypothetical protein
MSQVIDYGRPVAQVSLDPSAEIDALPYVEWSAVFAGTVVALAVSFVLSTFGAAVGLSAVSPWTSTRTSVAAVSYGAAFWMILVHIWAFALGGYLAARMRHRRRTASASEVEFRDGAHGATVWGVSVTVGAIIAALVAASIVRGGLQAGATAVSTDPSTIATDALLRSNSRSPADGRFEDMRAEIGRLLAVSGGQGGLALGDRTYLVQLIATRTGLSQPEAEKRIEETLTQLKIATDKDRKGAIVLGFITAATLLLGAAASWVGGVAGGKDRDGGTVWHGLGGQSSIQSFWS